MGPGEGSGGKALRPALALLSARAAGAPPERGVTAAVAVELVHNFSLLHDDIMDNDTERRHRPTAWTVFGVGAAILAGDALLALAQDMLLEDSNPQGAWAARCLSAAVQRLIGGQGSDLAFEKRDNVTLAECLDMAGDKTAALMACACSIGAVHLGAPPTLAMALAGFGAHVGLAFQLTDDLLGIWGAPEVTGKPVRADLRARKKSLPVVAALTSETRQGRELGELLARDGDLSEEELILAVLHRGDCFGEMSLLDIQPRSATVRARTDVSLLVLPYRELLGLEERDHHTFALFVLNIAREVSRRLREAQRLLVTFELAALEGKPMTQEVFGSALPECAGSEKR